MAITERDVKILWARAAGHCSAPGCPIDLTPSLAKSGDIVLGEMAHVIGRSPGAARSNPAIGADDGYDNLILLCPNHHTIVDKGEADHPPALLKRWKGDWEAEVTRRLMTRVSVGGGDILEMRLWTYFNFAAILELHSKLCPGGLRSRALVELRLSGAVTDDGFPVEGTHELATARTLFETWPQHRAHALQQFYSSMVEQIIHKSPPLDLDEVWGIRKLRGLLYPTALVCLNRRCLFKTIRRVGEHEERQARCTAQKIEVAFQLSTWNIFSNSSLTLHLRGSSRVTALLMIRSVEQVKDMARVRLMIKATPIALGSGFAPSHDRTPVIAERNRFDGEDYAF
ncbi:MAG: HNH endonuclease signature motif containing protein [Phycisphaerales bacterium]